MCLALWAALVRAGSQAVSSSAATTGDDEKRVLTAPPVRRQKLDRVSCPADDVFRLQAHLEELSPEDTVNLTGAAQLLRDLLPAQHQP